MILSYELCSDFIWSSCQSKQMARDDLLTETQMSDLHMTLCSKLKIWNDPGFRVHQRMTSSTWNFVHYWVFLLKVSKTNHNIYDLFFVKETYFSRLVTRCEPDRSSWRYDAPLQTQPQHFTQPNAAYSVTIVAPKHNFWCSMQLRAPHP